jgi:hypothetical protein
VAIGAVGVRGDETAGTLRRWRDAVWTSGEQLPELKTPLQPRCQVFLQHMHVRPKLV